MSVKRRRRLVYTISVFMLILGLLSYWLFRWVSDENDTAKGSSIGPGVTASGPRIPDGMKAVETAVEGLPYPARMKLISTPVKITPHGELQSSDGNPYQLSLRFRLTQKVDPKRDLVLVVTSEAGRAPWQFIEPVISADGWYAQVTTSHLSDWAVVRGDSNDIALDFAADLKKTLTGTAQAAQKPRCKNPPEKDDPSGYGASYPDDKDALYVCMNKEGSDYILYIVNRKSYPLSVWHTANLKPSHKGEINNRWGNLIPSPGKDKFILFPRDKAAFKLDLKRGDSGRINTEFSGYGQSLYRLDVGLTALFSIVDRFGIGSPKPGTAEYMDLMKKAVQYKGCAEAVQTDKPAGEIYGTCFPRLAEGDPYGKVGTDIIFSVVRSLNSLKDYIASEFRSMWESLRDADRFSILVGRIRVDPFDKYVGVWNTHGTTLRIRADGTGSMVSNAGSCTPSVGLGDPAGNKMCEEHDKLSLKMDGSKLVATVTDVSFTASGGGQYESCDVEVCGNMSHKGMRLKIEYMSAGQLKVTYSLPPNNWEVYYCNSKSNDKERANCGA